MRQAKANASCAPTVTSVLFVFRSCFKKGEYLRAIASRRMGIP